MHIWNDFVSELEKEIGKGAVAKWIRPLKVLSFDASNIHLEAEDPFQAIWFDEHVKPKLKRSTIYSPTGKKVKLHLTVKNQKPPSDETTPDSVKEDAFAPSPLEPHCQLSQFICGTENELSFRVFAGLVGFDRNTTSFKDPTLSLGEMNPIYLYGNHGVGKTHLLMAVASALKNKGYNVRYVKAETFTDHVIKAYREGQVHTFRERYRAADVFIIDGIDILSRKATTQEELFHTFNTLHTAGKQIIVAAHKSPQHLSQIEPRLISRFEWGILLELNKLTKEERKQFLTKRLESLQFPLQDHAAEHLLSHFSSNTSLSKAIETLLLRLHVSGTSPDNLTPEAISHHLSDLMLEEKRREVTPDKLISAVAKAYTISPEDLLGKSKAKEHVLPRQVAMFLCREDLTLPYTKIGSLFQRDHSTVISSVRLIKKAIEKKHDNVLYPLSTIYTTLQQ